MLSRTAPRSRGTPATRSTTAAAALCTMKNHICRADPPSDRPPHCQGACTVVPIDLRSCPAPAMAPSPSATSTRSGSRLRALLDQHRYMYCCCCCSYNLNSFKLFSARRPPLHVHVLPLLRPRLPTMLLPLLQPRLLLSCALELFSPRTPTATTSIVAPLSHPARVGGSTVSQVDPRIPRI